MRTAKQIKGDNYEKTVTKILMNPNFGWTKNNVSFDVQKSGPRVLGKSTLKHQIDIHLSSTLNPEYHLICECKCYNKRIGKQKASAFFGIFNDIKKKHKDWKLIAVYASDEGFTRDAKKMLLSNDVGIIDLKDVSSRVVKLSITESSIRPDITIHKIVLEDGSEAKRTDLFRNDDRGEFFRVENIVGSFECVDENQKIIKSLSSHYGFFKTRKQIVKHSDFDVFYRVSDNRAIKEIRGFVGKPIKSNYGTSTSIAKSNVDGILTLHPYRYIFYKNGSIKKEKILDLNKK